MKTQFIKLALTAVFGLAKHSQLQQGEATMRTHKLIAIFLAVFAIVAYAENAAQLKTTIDSYIGCTGNLKTNVNGNTVTITDTLDCKDEKILTLDIDAGITVVWKANFTGNVKEALIVKKGKGLLEIQSGYIKNSFTNSLYNAIRVDGGDLIISGGTISAQVGYGVKNNSTGTITITGGTISMSGGQGISVGVQNNSTGTVNIKGGTIKTDYTVQNTSTGTVNISGGTLLANNRAIDNISTGTVNISGGEISAGNGIVINSVGKVVISTPVRITSK